MMKNRFGFDLYPKKVRWAAAEGVSDPPRLGAGQPVHHAPAGLVLETSECMRRLVKQFELSGQRRDT